jgi:hypothetical protein
MMPAMRGKALQKVNFPSGAKAYDVLDIPETVRATLTFSHRNALPLLNSCCFTSRARRSL